MNIGITHRDQELINDGIALQALLPDGSSGLNGFDTNEYLLGLNDLNGLNDFELLECL